MQNRPADTDPRQFTAYSRHFAFLQNLPFNLSYADIQPGRPLRNCTVTPLEAFVVGAPSYQGVSIAIQV